MTNWNKEIRRAAERASEVTVAVIRKQGSKYCVYSKKTGRKFGCYPTREQAEERMKQLEKFKHMSEEGKMDGKV